MKAAAPALAALIFAVAGSAFASTHVSDAEYIQASRCKGIASAVGADNAGLDAFVKTESAVRSDYILQKGEEEVAKVKREARDSLMRDRLSAELSSSCAAYLGGKSVAAK